MKPATTKTTVNPLCADRKNHQLIGGLDGKLGRIIAVNRIFPRFSSFFLILASFTEFYQLIPSFA